MPAKHWERWLRPFTVISKTALAFAVALLASAARPAPVTWQNVTLGEPASALRAVLGDPLRIVAFDKDDTRVARYWLPGANSTYLLVIERRGYAEGFDVFTDTAPSEVLANVAPDPSGVRLGDTMDSVKRNPRRFPPGSRPRRQCRTRRQDFGRHPRGVRLSERPRLPLPLVDFHLRKAAQPGSDKFAARRFGRDGDLGRAR